MKQKNPSHPWRQRGYFAGQFPRTDAQKETDSPMLDSEWRRELFRTQVVIESDYRNNHRTMENV